MKNRLNLYLATQVAQSCIFTTRFFKLLNNEEKLKIKLGDMQTKANEIIEELEGTIDKQAAEIAELKAIIRKMKSRS